MLTLRRGIARVGWVLLASWLAVWTVLFVVARSQATNPPPIDTALAIQLAAFLFGYPLAIFLVWRLLLWIGQGFWKQPTAPPVVDVPSMPSAIPFHLPPEFWTIRTMALLGAVLFVAYGIFSDPTEWALGGDHAARAVGGLVANASIGAIVGAVIARFLPRPS